MRITAKIDYACRALLELSLHWPNNTPLQIDLIAKRQNIPIKFLTQILLNLKQLGFAKSTRGKKGGYLLSMPPEEIKLSDLIERLGNMGYSIAEDRQKSSGKHVFDVIWKELDAAVFKTMEGINFEDICNRKRKRDKIVMFEI